MALAVENASRLDHQAGSLNLPGHNSLRLNLHASPGKYPPVEAAGDDHVIALDLALHARAFAEHQRLIGDDRPSHLRFQAESALYFEGAFQTHGLVHKPRP